MGGNISGAQLLPDFENESKRTINEAKLIARKFEKVQTGFGWGIDVNIYAKLLKLTPTRAQELWLRWDTDQNESNDALEILSALMILSCGNFEDKVSAVFSLFDFDENGVLTIDEVTIMCRTSLIGLSKAMGAKEPTTAEIEHFTHKAMESVSKPSATRLRRVSRDEFMHWILSSASIMKLLAKFGTTNIEAAKKKFGVKDSTAVSAAGPKRRDAKEQKLGGGVGSTAVAEEVAATLNLVAAAMGGTKGKPAGDGTSAAAAGSKRGQSSAATGFISMGDVRRAKAIFDSIDIDGSGTISLKELAESLRDNAFAELSSTFQMIDRDKSGVITFDELLQTMFPKCPPQQIKAVIEDLYGPTVNKEHVEKLTELFEELDMDNFDGKVNLKLFVAEAKEQKQLEPLVRKSIMKEDKDVTFPVLLTELFSRTHKHLMPQLLSWAAEKPVRFLSADQMSDLERIFDRYDKDGSGFILLDELKQHSERLGLVKEDYENVFKHFDENADQRITLREFRRFYRDIWDTGSAMRSRGPSLPTTHAYAHGSSLHSQSR